MSFGLQGKPELQHLPTNRRQTLHMQADTLIKIALFTLSFRYKKLFCCRGWIYGYIFKYTCK